MSRLKIFLSSAAVVWGLSALSAQQVETPTAFTAAQAEAGRTAYQSTCVKCHTGTLLGRKGESGELPPVDSLPSGMQDVVRGANGQIPPLTGPAFLARWGARTTQDLSSRVREAVGGFRPDGATGETYLDLTAYFLQVSGAKPGKQALTPTTSVEVRSLLPTAASEASPKR